AALVAAATAVVVVGLSKIRTPSNRADEVWAVLGSRNRDVPKISVDRTLFVSEPWRAWFHWGLLAAPYREYTYSYLAESQWRSWVDGARPDDPFSLAELRRWGRGLIRSHYRAYFDRFDVEVIPVGSEAPEVYAEAKTAAFDEERTLAAVLRRLAAVAQAECPRRTLPTPARLFDRTRHRIVVSDLPIDRFLVAHLWGLVEVTDGIGRSFYAGAP
ncbi:MAG: hypothetical protein ABIL09_27405, partial [Gemmatimonadota bacterium]